MGERREKEMKEFFEEDKKEKKVEEKEKEEGTGDGNRRTTGEERREQVSIRWASERGPRIGQEKRNVPRSLAVNVLTQVIKEKVSSLL